MSTFTVDQLIELRSSLADAICYSSGGSNFGVAPTAQLEKTVLNNDEVGWGLIAFAKNDAGQLVDLITFDSDDVDPLAGTTPEAGTVIWKFENTGIISRLGCIEAIETWLFDNSYGLALSGVWQSAESFTYDCTLEYLDTLFDLMNTIADRHDLVFKAHVQDVNTVGFWSLI